MFTMKNKKGILRGTIIVMMALLFFSIKADADELNAPKLLGLYTQTRSGGGFTARITFEADEGNTCYIYRKPIGGHYIRIGKVTADDDVISFTDRKVPDGCDYIYTVRQRGLGIYNNRLSRYDHDGLRTIRGKTSVTTKVGNLNTRISWRGIKGADGYRIYRKMENGRFEYVGSVGKNSTTFTDVYSRTFPMYQKRQYLSYGCYLDTSSHTVSYAVRATLRSIDFDKISLSPYDKDGYYKLNAPVIVDFDQTGLDRGIISFTSVPYANLYLVQLKYKEKGKTRYYSYASIYRTHETYVDCQVPVRKGLDYCVRALADRNGKTISARSGTFTLKYRNYSVHNILYIGDSITYGSPYKTDLNRYIFSYPWRVMQLTGSDYYNAAIPGATMAYSPVSTAPFHRYRIVKDVIPRISLGTTPNAVPGLLEPNHNTFDKFDTVILYAGTNDYTDLIPIGDINSMDDKTYCGALNTALDAIEKASDKRVKDGRTPIKVIMPDLMYSDRCTSFEHRQDRFRTKNALGYTLTSYNKARNNVLKKYRRQGLHVYNFRTSSFVNEKNCPYTTADNLHMTKYTYEKMGDALTRYLVNTVWPD